MPTLQSLYQATTRSIRITTARPRPTTKNTRIIELPRYDIMRELTKPQRKWDENNTSQSLAKHPERPTKMTFKSAMSSGIARMLRKRGSAPGARRSRHGREGKRKSGRSKLGVPKKLDTLRRTGDIGISTVIRRSRDGRLAANGDVPTDGLVFARSFMQVSYSVP